MQEQDLIREIAETREIEVNGRKYILSDFSFSESKPFMRFIMENKNDLESENFACFFSDDFLPLEKKLSDKILFEGDRLSLLKNHLDEYQEDYILLFSMAVMVVAYPFMRGLHTA